MMDVITMSSKGQFVIPRDIREEMGLEMKDKFVIVYDKDNILLKRISKEEARKSMIGLMNIMSTKFKRAGIKKSDVEEEIKKSRR